MRTAGLCLLALLTLSHTLLAQAQSARADSAIVRLPPSAFRRLPAPVRRRLEQRGCTVPQVYSDRHPGNVVSGHFASRARTDWAILCSVNHISRIMVFWAGRDSVTELAAAPDADYLQGLGHGSAVGYSRAIGVAHPDQIRREAAAFGGGLPPVLDHDGLEDAFVEKASVIRYYYRGRWLELQGAD
jgi:hypothetical protein